MRRIPTLFVLGVCACGSSRPGAKPAPEPTPVLVPDDSEPEDEPGAVEEAGRPEARSGSSLTDCAATLRADPGVTGSPADTEAYGRALSFERSGELSSARKAYFDVVANTPQSPYIPFAYLAFGEMFAQEAEGDPSKWDLAGQAYKEVIKYPPPQNSAWAYAMYRLAEVERKKGDSQQSLASYVKVVAAARERPDARCAAQLLAESRRGAAVAFADAGQPDKAYQFFQRTDPAQADAWLAELVDEYVKRGKTSEACAAVRAAPSSAEAARSRAKCP